MVPVVPVRVVVEEAAEAVDEGDQIGVQRGDGQAGDHVAEDRVRDALVQVVGAAHQHRVPDLAGPGDQLGHQPGLADARLAPDQQRRRCAALDALELLQSDGQVQLPAHQWRHLHRHQAPSQRS